MPFLVRLFRLDSCGSEMTANATQESIVAGETIVPGIALMAQRDIRAHLVYVDSLLLL